MRKPYEGEEFLEPDFEESRSPIENARERVSFSFKDKNKFGWVSFGFIVPKGEAIMPEQVLGEYKRWVFRKREAYVDFHRQVQADSDAWLAAQKKNVP